MGGAAVQVGDVDLMEAAFKSAQMSHQPVFGYYWAPTALMGKYDWHILKEPPYTDQCWQKISSAVKDRNLRPIDQACAYENLPIEKVVHKSLLKNAQDVVAMLEKMVVGLEPLNKTLAWAKETEDAQTLLQMANDLWLFWFRAGYRQEGAAWTETALRLDRGGADSVPRSLAMNHLCSLLANLGRFSWNASNGSRPCQTPQ